MNILVGAQDVPLHNYATNQDKEPKLSLNILLAEVEEPR